MEQDQPTPLQFPMWRLLPLCGVALAVEMAMTNEKIYMVAMLQSAGVPTSLVPLPGILSGAIGLVAIPLLGWASDNLPKRFRCLGQRCPFAVLTITYLLTATLTLVGTNAAMLYHTQTLNDTGSHTAVHSVNETVLAIVAYTLCDHGYDASTSTVAAYLLSATPRDQHDSVLVLTRMMAAVGACMASGLGFVDLASIFPQVIQHVEVPSHYQYVLDKGTAQRLVQSIVLLVCILLSTAASFATYFSNSKLLHSMSTADKQAKTENAKKPREMDFLDAGHKSEYTEMKQHKSGFTEQYRMDSGSSEHKDPEKRHLLTEKNFKEYTSQDDSSDSKESQTDSSDTEESQTDSSNTEESQTGMKFKRHARHESSNDTAKLIPTVAKHHKSERFNVTSRFISNVAKKDVIFLCFMAALGFLAEAVYVIYQSNYMAHVIFGGDPYASPVSAPYEKYVNGVQMGSLSMLTFNCVYLAFTFALRWILWTIGIRTEYMTTSLTAAVLTLTLALTDSMAVLFINSAAMAAYRATVYTLPFILSNNYSQQGNQKHLAENDVPHADSNKTGAAIALVTTMSPASFFLVSFVLAPLLEATGDARVPIYITSGACFLSFLSSMLVTFN